MRDGAVRGKKRKRKVVITQGKELNPLIWGGRRQGVTIVV